MWGINLKSNKTLFKSIFSKYFTATAVLISLAFLLTAAIQLLLARSYWIEDKRVALEDRAQNVSNFVIENVVEAQPGVYQIPNSISPALTHLANMSDSSVLVTDNEFRIIYCSHPDCSHGGKLLSESVSTGLQRGSFFEVGRLGGLYSDRQYTAGAELRVDNGETLGYVLISSSASALGEFVMDNMKTYVLAGVAALVMAFIVLYIITYQLVRPLRQMAAITRRFSQGDFSGRVKVRGNDEVSELATALNGMAVSLSSLEDMRRSFVANVSHELKTPMTTISGFIDGILDGTVPPEKRADYLRIVSEETKRLSRLVGVMLNLSRIDSGSLKINPVSFDLTSTVCEVLLSFEQRIDGKHLSIEGLEDCAPQQVCADYDLLQQVVYNLMDNAVKFTNDGGTITLSVSGSADRVVFTIRNTGDGIPPEEMPHIFERFYKSDRSRGLDKNGTGLGLYIVKTMIDLHGGEITVRSAEGEYCKFSFWLPTNSAPLQKK